MSFHKGLDFNILNAIFEIKLKMDLNKFGKRAWKCALRRGKVHETTSFCEFHDETLAGLNEEVDEVNRASETEESVHLDGYSEIVEELTDVAIVAFTELYRRGIDIEKVLHEKMKCNERR